MVMPISQCDLGTHFILKMNLPSICLSCKSCFCQASTWNKEEETEQPPSCPLLLPHSQIVTNTKRGTSTETGRDQRADSPLSSLCFQEVIWRWMLSWCNSEKQRQTKEIYIAISCFHVLLSYLDLIATHPKSQFIHKDFKIRSLSVQGTSVVRQL